MIIHIKDIRNSKGKTQEELARKLDISLKSYQNIESGKQEPSVITALKLAKSLNVLVEDLYSIDE